MTSALVNIPNPIAQKKNLLALSRAITVEVKQIILFYDFFCKEGSQIELTSVSKIPIIFSRSDFV